MSDGTLELNVLRLKRAVTKRQDPGYVIASTGAVSVETQTITISWLTLASGAIVTVTYGSPTDGGPGATAPTKAASVL